MSDDDSSLIGVNGEQDGDNDDDYDYYAEEYGSVTPSLPSEFDGDASADDFPRLDANGNIPKNGGDDGDDDDKEKLDKVLDKYVPSAVVEKIPQSILDSKFFHMRFIVSAVVVCVGFLVAVLVKSLVFGGGGGDATGGEVANLGAVPRGPDGEENASKAIPIPEGGGTTLDMIDATNATVIVEGNATLIVVEGEEEEEEEETVQMLASTMTKGMTLDIDGDTLIVEGEEETTTTTTTPPPPLSDDDSWGLPPTSDRYRPLRSAILSSSSSSSYATNPSPVSPRSAFLDADSPQHRALVWLADSDPLQLSPPSSDDDDNSGAAHLLQRYILTTFYYASGGSKWLRRDGWLTGSSECEWEGVQCQFEDTVTDEDTTDGAAVSSGAASHSKGDGRHVIKLELFRNGLTGSIAEEVGYLDRLMDVDLSGNDGNEAGGGGGRALRSRNSGAHHYHQTSRRRRRHLAHDETDRDQKLQRKDKGLGGPIPSTLGHLPTLRRLDLGNNAHTGPIPPALFSNPASRLEFLNLANNLLNATLPSSAVGLSSSLRRVYLSSNLFTGTLPPSLGDLDGLHELHLNSNSFTGLIPPQLGRLGDTLTQLGLHGNALGGIIPDALHELGESLEALYLDNNALTGVVPSWLFDGRTMRNLADLRLHGNLLGGRLPPFGGGGGGSGGGAPSSTTSEGGGNSDGGDTTMLNKMEKLELLYLHENAFTGSIPPTLYTTLAPSLSELQLYSNALTGTVSANIGNLTRLRVCYLDRNALSGSLPPTLGGLEILEYFRADDNMLDGTLPPTLGKLGALKKLHLHSNRFTGLLHEFADSAWGTMTSLEVLFLDDNRLGGSLPSDRSILSSLTHLRKLHLANNVLTGELPPSLGDMKALEDLSLGNNALTGTIPFEMEGLGASLRVLNLRNNTLSGMVPKELGKLASLRVLNLDGNDLSGIVPKVVCSLTAAAGEGGGGGGSLTEFTADCGKTPPKVMCSCCTECAP